MSSTNNIKDALIRNNTMIANELKTNFAKKSEVSELATDKVDKETDNHYGSGQPSSTATISNVTGAVMITSTGTNPNEIKLEKRHGSASLDSQGDYRNTIAIGNGDQLILESKSNINGSEFQTNSISIAPDGILVERDLFDGDDHDTTIYNLMAELNKVEVLDELTDNWIEYGIDSFNFNKVFSGDNNIIASQTIIFGSQSTSNYESLLDLSALIKGNITANNDKYYDNTNYTTFISKSTPAKGFSIPVKKGGKVTFTGKIDGTTITVNNQAVDTSTWTSESTAYNTPAATYDQFITFAFTQSNTNIKTLVVTNFVNVYITENKLRANYYNKSETDALIASQIIPGINAQVWDSNHEVERDIIDFGTNEFEIKLQNHAGNEDAHQLIMNSGNSAGHIALVSDFGTDAPCNQLKIERDRVALEYYKNDEGDEYNSYIKEGYYDTNDASKFGMQLLVETNKYYPTEYYSRITLHKDNIEIFCNEGDVDIGSEYSQVRLVGYGGDDSSILTLGNGNASLAADSIELSGDTTIYTSNRISVIDGSITTNQIAYLSDITTYTLALGGNNNNFWFATVTAESGLENTYTGTNALQFIEKYARYVSWYYENSNDTSGDNHKMCTFATPGQQLNWYLADGTMKITTIPPAAAVLTVTKAN